MPVMSQDTFRDTEMPSASSELSGKTTNDHTPSQPGGLGGTGETFRRNCGVGLKMQGCQPQARFRKGMWDSRWGRPAEVGGVGKDHVLRAEPTRPPNTSGAAQWRW